ncbi:hypothetical protein AAMO2058_000904200 [Amorphochlora amoebiformis]
MATIAWLAAFAATTEASALLSRQNFGSKALRPTAVRNSFPRLLRRFASGGSGEETLPVGLEDVQVKRVSDSEGESVKSLLGGKKKVLGAFLTQWGDFDSFEMAQRLVPKLSQLEAAGVEVIGIGIGSVEGAKEFSRLTGFPADKLWVDESASSYKLMGFAPGFGRRGEQKSEWWNSETVLKATQDWSPYAKLLVMCAGVGSPGTLQEVFRGYLGDRESPEIQKRFPGVLPDWMPGLFGVLGDGYQRPFELATVRLINMNNILTRWELLTPKDKALILQRGGAVVIENDKIRYKHSDRGILGYADVDELVARALDTQTEQKTGAAVTGGEM